jgi:hypothetical protein
VRLRERAISRSRGRVSAGKSGSLWIAEVQFSADIWVRGSLDPYTRGLLKMCLARQIDVDLLSASSCRNTISPNFPGELLAHFRSRLRCSPCSIRGTRRSLPQSRRNSSVRSCTCRAKCADVQWGILLMTPDAVFCLRELGGGRGRGDVGAGVDACVRGRTGKRRCMRADAQHRQCTKRGTQPAQAAEVYQGVEEGCHGFRV